MQASNPSTIEGYLADDGTLAQRGAAITPRVRINLKQLANRTWQQDVTLEVFDCDPGDDRGFGLIAKRLAQTHRLVEAEIDRRMTGEAPMPT